MTDSPDGDALRRFLEQVLGGSLPEGALEGMDLEALARQAGLPSDPAQLQAAAMAMRSMMAQGGDGPVNWRMAHDLARQAALGRSPLDAAQGREVEGTPGDPDPGAVEVRDTEEAYRIAALWLSPVTDFDAVPDPVRTWSRSTWVEDTMPTWQRVVEPVAKYMSQALGDALEHQFQELQEQGLAFQAGTGALDPAQMMKQMGGTMYGVQFGQAIGRLAREVLSGADLGLPLTVDDGPVSVPVNVRDFLAGLDIDPMAARIYLAAREIAHVELFRSAPWLAGQLYGAIEVFARSTRIDLGTLEEHVREIDISDPMSLQGALPEGIFEFTRTPDQERSLEELATTLALIEGWVDHVVSRAMADKLPQLPALRETMLRRRASGGPAEDFFSSVVGLELRPRRIREATAWWDSVQAEDGEAARDAKWSHPDLLPDADELAGREQPERETDDIDEQMSDFDAELSAFLDSAEGDDARGASDGGAPDSGATGDDPGATGDEHDDGHGETGDDEHE